MTASASTPVPAPLVPAPVWTGNYHVSVGLAAKGRVVLVATFPCKDSVCPPDASADLGNASSVDGAQLLDLMGPPVSVSPRSPHGPSTLAPEAGMPAAVVGLTLGGTSRLTLVSFKNGRATLIWTDETFMEGADGGGFSTINTVDFEAGAPGSPLTIEIVQTAMPGRHAREYRPGPPLHRRYVFDGTRYVPAP